MCSTTTIVETLTSRPPVMPPDLVPAVTHELRTRLQEATATGRAPDRAPSRPPERAARIPGRPRSTPARRSRRRSEVARLLVALAVIGVVALNPQVVTGVAQAFANVFVGSLTDDLGSEPADEPRKRDNQKGKKGKNGQKEPAAERSGTAG